ncbi:MAG TPA: hypothetical protein VFU33_02910 [Gaiellaceae bacterium]|nr:hypothetical protein [Gaiellaceae bacterium]
MRFLLRLLGRRRPMPRPADPERLQRIYRETHRHVEELRRAA